MSSHPHRLDGYTRLMIVFTIPRPYPIVLPKHRRPIFSDRGINTKAASAQVLVDYLNVSLDTSCIFLLHNPDST
jgi:hypothetical protein